MGLDETSHQLLLLFYKLLSGTSNGSRAVAFPPVAFLLYLILPGLVLLHIFAFYVAQNSAHLGRSVIYMQISMDGIKAAEKGT